MKTAVVVGNIVDQTDAHALVNSASRSLKKGSGVSAAIHAGAGPELEVRCSELAPVAPGGAVITWGFGLPNTYVIHLVISRYANEPHAADELEQALDAMMKIANKENIYSLSMPAIGTGFHNFPPQLVAELTARVLARHATSGTSVQWIRICVANASFKHIFLQALEKQTGMGWGPVANVCHPVSFTVLPDRRVSLDCRMSFPVEYMKSVTIGWECQSQDDKWSWCYVAPWLQFWRPGHWGFLAVALRLAQHDERMYIAESWADGCVIEKNSLGNINQLRQLVVELSRWAVYQYSDEFLDPLVFQKFSFDKMSGTVDLGCVTFSGEADSADMLRKMAKVLLEQANHLDSLAPCPTYALETTERFQGCLFGLACGDAVGTTVEFRKRGTFTPVTDMVGGGPFAVAPGQWTDDTSMALCLAASLTELGEFSASDQMVRYLRWVDSGYMSSNGRCFDIGRTVRSALIKYQQTGEPFSGSTSPDAAGNGALMRLAPVVMFYYPDRCKALLMAERSTRTTHGATECVEASRLFAAMLMNALAGSTKEAILLGHGITHLTSPGLVSVANGGYFDKTVDQIKGSGYVVQSLEAALWCFWTSSNFEAAILKATNLGDDADTTAAICGQIAGAHYGESAIPKKWLARISMKEDIADLAKKLYQTGATQ